MTFPETWPNCCPPEDSASQDSTVYHILQDSPPGTRDLLSFMEKGKTFRGPPPECPCIPYAISVFQQREDAIWMRRAMPKLGRFVAKGVLSANDGKCKLTAGKRPSHTSWWPSCECNRSSCFTEAEELH